MGAIVRQKFFKLSTKSRKSKWEKINYTGEISATVQIYAFSRKGVAKNIDHAQVVITGFKQFVGEEVEIRQPTFSGRRARNIEKLKWEVMAVQGSVAGLLIVSFWN